MKRFKGFLELIKNLIVFLIVGLWWVWAIILFIIIRQAIVLSDLSFWTKFWLLN